MRLVRSRSTGKKAIVEGCLQLEQCSMSHQMQPTEAPQRSIGLFAMRHGEGELEFARFGRRGIIPHHVKSSHTPPMVLYPSVSALEVSKSLENDMARIIHDDGGFNVPGVGTCVVPSFETLSRLQTKERHKHLCGQAGPLLEEFMRKKRFQAAYIKHQANSAAAIIRRQATQALAEKEAALVRLEAALVRQEEDGLNNAVRLMVQSPLLEAIKEDSRAMRQAILDLQHEKDEATEVAEGWKASSEAVWSRCASLEADRTEAQDKVQTKSNEFDDLQQLSERQSEAVLTLQQEKAAAGVEAAQWQAASQAAQRSCDRADARRTEVEGQLLATNTEVAGLRQASVQHSEAMSSLQHEISEAEMEVALWKPSFEEAQSSFDSSEARRIEVEGQLLAKSNGVVGFAQASAQQSASIASLQQEKAAALGVAAQCKGELEQMTAQMSTLQSQSAGSEARIITLEGLLQTESSDANNLRHQLSSQAEAMSALRQQKGAAEVATNHWKEQCEAGQAREGLASASRAKLEGQLKANSTEVDQLCLSSNQQAQDMLCLQQGKAEAGVEAAHPKASSQAAQTGFDNAEAKRIQVEGPLAKKAEVDGLQQASVEHSQSGLQQQKNCVHAAARHWKEQCEAGQAREGQLKANSTVDQLRSSSQQHAQAADISKQEEQAKQVKVQTAEPELDTAQLRTQAAESQRIVARSPQQALPEMAVSGSGHQAQDVEHGTAGLMPAHHSPRPKMGIVEEARAAVGFEFESSQAVRSRGGGAGSSSSAASRPALSKMGTMEEEEAKAPVDSRPAATSQAVRSRGGAASSSSSAASVPALFKMHGADASMVRALAPAGPERQAEQASSVRQVANATQSACSTSQVIPATMEGVAKRGAKAEGAVKRAAKAEAAVRKVAAKAEEGIKWVQCPHFQWLEWPEDATQRRLSHGATAVVLRARVKGEADLTDQQLPAGLQPGQQVAIKQVQDADHEVPRALAQREEAVLTALADKPYAPKLYACQHSQEVDASSGSMRECANLLMELVEGNTLHSIICAVRSHVLKYRNDPAKLKSLRRWLWYYTSFVAHGLAEILADLHEERSHRDLKPQNIMVAQSSNTGNRNKVTVKLVDFAASRKQSEDDLNCNFTRPYAAPLLLDLLSNGVQPMLDEPNDMWAVATVLFELVMSGYPDWTQQHGPLMFGASPADLAAGAKLQDQEEWMAFSVGRIKAAHELWASFAPFTQNGPKPAQLLALQDAANGEGLLLDLRDKYSRTFKKLFEGMLLPDAAQRMTAAQMLEVLQDASFKLLNTCPFRM